MTPTAKALRQLARQLDRAYRHASLGGNDVSVRVKDPRILINIMRRVARELER